MIFLGYAFAGGDHSIDPTLLPPNDISSIVIENGIYDYLYATVEDLSYSTDAPSEWNFDTRLYAKFDGDLLAGNINFALNEVNLLKLKRRKYGDTSWTTIYEQSVSTSDDLSILFYDRTARSNTKYEYTIVPVIGQVEGDFFTNAVTTDYQGIFITDGTTTFSTELDVSITEKRIKPRSIITTINRKYPYVISNGSNNYDSGTISAQWLEYDPGTDDWDITNGREFVKNLKDFLNESSPKLIKYQDGRMWLAEISSSDITDSEDEHHLQVHTSFDFTEIGNCDDGSDLYDNGLIDVEQ